MKRIAALLPWLVLLAAVDGGAYTASQVNAKAVSVQWRHGIGTDWSSMCCECWNEFPIGAIKVYTITGGVVQSNPVTIYDRSLGMATYPAFNLSGTKVAFFRSSTAPATTGNSCLTVNGGKSYVSIINTDGTGLTNLVEIPSPPEGTGNGNEMLPLDWPAGDWIYYTRPYDINSAPGGNSGSVDIWRVNSVSKAAERVCDFSQGSMCVYWRRFSLTLGANKMAGQSMGKYECNGGPGGGNCIWDFPVSGCNLNNSKGECRAACNISISPSGAVVGSYFSGAHTQLELGQGTPGTYSFGWGWGVDLFAQVAAWAGEDVGEGCELIRWAVNSDKWVLQNVGWYGHASNIATGSNSVACDWIDHVAFNITKNPKPPSADVMGYMFINNCTGDMWISDPANNPQGNKYEDLQGVWHTCPGATAVENPAAMGWEPSRNGIAGITSDISPSIRIHVTNQGPWKVSIAGVDGRTTRLLSGVNAGDISVPAAGMNKGISVITLMQGGNHFVNRCVVR
jgi:hypothetical protein